MTQAEVPIPITVRIGVTGHRELANADHLAGSIRRVLSRLDDTLRHTPHAYIVVSPLAEGADQLVARVVLDWPAPGDAPSPALEVPLPLPEPDYLQAFTANAGKEGFQRLFARAHSFRVLDATADLPAAYDQAGRYVVQHCDLLVAIWDGEPARGQGGTAEIVEYARQMGRTVLRIEAATGRLMEEEGSDQALEALGRLDSHNADLPNHS